MAFWRFFGRSLLTLVTWTHCALRSFHLGMLILYHAVQPEISTTTTTTTTKKEKRKKKKKKKKKNESESENGLLITDMRSGRLGAIAIFPLFS